MMCLVKIFPDLKLLQTLVLVERFSNIEKELQRFEIQTTRMFPSR